MSGFCFCFSLYWVGFEIIPPISILLMGTLELVPCALNNLARPEVNKKLTSSFEESKNIIH